MHYEKIFIMKSKSLLWWVHDWIVLVTNSQEMLMIMLIRKLTAYW